MNKTELLNRIAADPDQRLLLARVLDKAELTRSRDVPSHTHFLTPADRRGTEDLLAAWGHPRHLFFGGYDQAERTLCAFLPQWMEEDTWQESDCPVVALHLVCPGGQALTHRDYLGSILGLGITREKIGDLLVTPCSCHVLLLEEAAPILQSQLSQVGRCRVTITPVPLDQLTPPEQKMRQIRDTVATLRLDAVASSAFSLARGKMADHISGGKVLLNGRECTKPDKQVTQGDIFTCRGLGKAKLVEVGGVSKKGRIQILLERYL